MSRQEVNIGTEGNDATGDSIRESFRKVNENFQELYAVFGQGGQISFTTLGDTPNELSANKIVTTNATGSAVIFSEIGSDSDLDSENDDSVTVDTTSVPGKIILSTSFSAIVDDTTAPTLGSHLDAANFGIAGVAISDAAATAINSQPGRSSTYSIDDLVITKGYADRRYITSGLPIRIAAEPANTDSYVLTIESYTNGNLFITGHGYDSGANGTAFVFEAEDTDPSGLTSGTTYYIRYVTDDQLALYSSQEYAQTEDQNDADNNKITVTGTISADDTHTITDAGYDEDLTGNFLSDVGMPRDSVTRRQGDTMEGALFLSDHPGNLAGAGTPNGEEDLQAASKYYVDNTAYSSPEVLHVSTKGDDTQSSVPKGREGSSFTYAYKTINAAAQKAAELISTAPEEPGPYFQTLTHSQFETNATVISAGVENEVFDITADNLQANEKFLIKEVSGYIAFTYPDFVYDVARCELDLSLVINSLRLDAAKGGNANYLSKTAAERYFSSVSGKIAVTQQLEQTDDSYRFLGEVIEAALQNKGLNRKAITSLTRKSGDTPARLVSSTAHGLSNKNIILFENMAGMTEIEDEFAYVKVIDTTTVELFSNEALTTPFDNSTYTPFVSGNFHLRYQTKYPQSTSGPLAWDGSTGGAEPNAASQIRTNVQLIRDIITKGPANVDVDIAYGNRYELSLNNSTAGELDQTKSTNTDARPGKVIRGKRSGAVGRIITFEQDTSSTEFYLILLEPKDFEAGEELEMGNFVKAKQVTIRVESGIYEEDYPIKVSKNVSIKGDEFRRVIVRPKRRVSQSTYANTYFYRDKTFDGITITTAGTPFINQTGEEQGFFGYHYLTDPTKPVARGDGDISNLGGYTKASKALERNRDYIVDKVIQYIDTQIADADQSIFPSDFNYNVEKCKRDTGIIVDGLIKDLRNGGKEFALENQGEYYEGSVAGQEDETVAAIQYISTLAGQILVNTDPGAGDSPNNFEADLTEGVVEPDWAAGNSYEQGTFVKSGSRYYKAKNKHTSVAGDRSGSILTSTKWTEVTGSVDLVGDLIDVIVFAFDDDYNPPKRNDEMDVFMMDDATILRNMTVQGHGGFMCVLDPEGQILTKSPYIQTGTSFSKSTNKKGFHGGMYVDAFAGNIPMRIKKNSGQYTDASGSVNLDAFTLQVESLDVNGQKQGLKLRLPQLPAPFYFEGIRYQVNAISNYDSGLGRAIVYLDPTSGNSNGWNKTGSEPVGDSAHDAADVEQDIFLQTAGNRSILGNDFTQINDLGYGLVTTNGAFSEMVSMFTYYCQAAYYANNGSEIRALNGSNGYGNFGLVAEGADPNEIPDQVTIRDNMIQPCKAFTSGSFTNALEDTSITVYDLKVPPLKNSILYINHGGSAGALNYQINNIENLSDKDNDGTHGESGDIIVTGISAINVAGITGSAPADGSFQNVATTCNIGSAAAANGTGATFNITISSGAVTATLNNPGEDYLAGNTVTVAGNLIGGTTPANDITIPVTSVHTENAGEFNNYVYKLTIQEGTSNNDFYANLQAAVAHDTLMEIRSSESFIFDGVNTQDITERPSTAINFDESDNVTYRSTSFTLKDDVGQDVASDEIKTVFDAPFKYATVTIDSANRSTSAPSGGGTLGSNITDTFLAVERIDDTIADRILQDATDTTDQSVLNPGDTGYVGGMIFSYGGRTHQAIDYGPITKGDVEDVEVDSGDGSITITSTGHGLSDSDQIEFADIGGMTQLNGNTYYVDVLDTDTFKLYTDDTLSSAVDGSAYNSFTSGGYWFTTDTVWYLETQFVTGTDVNGVSAAGIRVVPTADRDIHLGLIAGTTAEITIAISLLRATGHDFTQIGTGSFNDTNYPSVLLGDPIGGSEAKAGAYTDADDATKSQVWERRKGRVFFISSDNDGFFRVGKYFTVDQSTGSITFAGEVGISRAASLGFKDGVTIDEFSNDELFTDLSDTAVPTEKAIAAYVSRRLGHDGSAQLTGTSRFDPGFLALNGSTPMEANLNMNSKQIKNLLDPTSDNDAVTKDFLDQAVSAYDELDDLRNVIINSVGSADRQKQLFAPTGHRRLVATPNTGFNPTVGGFISDGTRQAEIVALETRFDKVRNENVNIITYLEAQYEDPGNPGSYITSPTDFSTTVATINDGSLASPSSNTATIVENPVDEFLNTVEDTASDINITVNRTSSGSTINLQIEADSILNADVNATADIAQSKLDLQLATGETAAPTGTDAQKQARSGLASFDSGDFTVTDGFVTIKEHGIDYADLPELATDTVIGRSAASTGDASAVTFGTVVDEGGAIRDSEISTELGYFSDPPTNSIVADPGAVIVATGTPGSSGTYAHTDVSYDVTSNSIAKRDNTGKLTAATFAVGGTSNTVLAESSGELTFTTADGGTILTAGGSGATKPDINTGGKIKVGDIANVTNSTLHDASDYGDGGDNEETSALASRWIYSSFIEAPSPKNANGTGIGIGTGLGFSTYEQDQATIFVSGTTGVAAAVRARINNSGLQTDAISSLTANTNLTISANGTGTVRVNDTMTVVNALTATDASSVVTNANNINVDEKNDSVNYQILFSTANGTGYQRPYIDTNNSHLTYNPSTQALGGVRAISTGGATTTGTITGRWSLTTNSRFEATYADLAEYYEGDAQYEVGTVVVFGGDKEITTSTTRNDTRVAGVVSDQSAYTMNQNCPGLANLIALQGRVPVKVIGTVQKGDMLVTSAIPGYAIADNNPGVGQVIGKALAVKTDDGKGEVEAVVGRV